VAFTLFNHFSYLLTSNTSSSPIPFCGFYFIPIAFPIFNLKYGQFSDTFLWLLLYSITFPVFYHQICTLHRYLFVAFTSFNCFFYLLVPNTHIYQTDTFLWLLLTIIPFCGNINTFLWLLLSF
jgi:hypothetical protein